LLQDK